MLKIIFKKTHELSDEEIRQYLALFLEVYQKEKPLKKFERQFVRTIFNYSYHALMVDDEKIVGNYTAVPLEYSYYGKKYIFALSVDTMISRKYRGALSNLKKMALLVYDALIRDGIPFIYGFPNKNFYLVKKRILNWSDMGQLDYYVSPLRIGALNSKLQVFDSFSLLFARFINRISNKTGTNSCEVDYPIEKINNDIFFAYRYDKSCNIVKISNGDFFVYKIDTEDGIRIAYLMDFCPVNAKLASQAINYIFHHEINNIDMIGYLGKMRVKPISLFKVPKWLERKPVNMSGKILINSLIDNRVYNIDNWNVNLSNFDVR